MIDQAIASRLVTDLMLVSVLVAGERAEHVAEYLRNAGAAADTLAGRVPGDYDLLIFLVPDEPGEEVQTTAKTALTDASDRVLIVPSHGGNAGSDDPPGGLTAWFEYLMELGFQPVVDFDAGFVAPGAFLVDRAATAGEEELAAFADRLQAAPTPPPAVAKDRCDPNSDQGIALQNLQARVDEQAAHITAILTQLAQAQASLQAASTSGTGWEGLRGWINATVRDPSRDTMTALMRDLPRLNALRSDRLPPLIVAGPEGPRPGFLARLFRRGATQATPFVSLLEDSALVRTSSLFDPAWYVASSAELSSGETVDPVFHYVFVGGPLGEDPGPYFDSAAYVAAHPSAGEAGLVPLVHAIRTGAREAAEVKLDTR